MPDYLVSVVIPTLSADSRLQECLEALGRQTRRDFEVIVVDNSGQGLARRNGLPPATRVIENTRNAGYGIAINQGLHASSAPYVASLNDDAVPHPDWLDALVRALEQRPDAGMCASQVRLFGEERLDSAGMLVARDGSSKQRGHGRMPDDFPVAEETLFPSGSAALYRRAMLEEIGGFDEHFFLYCEDTDLGLRARWAGWKCLYVPEAVVEHHYSHSAGRASPVKAYFVERNRLFVVAKNFPARMLLAAPFSTVARYLWHAWYILEGRGSAARFRAEGHGGPRMFWYVVRAHAALLGNGPRLWRQRREIRASARITPAIFEHLIASHSISARRVAAL
ncbi:MAG TPA: glycosyltransferase family 2 protein [Bryobacteraceae bacterium]|nr:glycosyltransferase family 2 protein [Bryobacteraceae bacterium]